MPGCPLCPRRRQPAPPGGLGHHSCMRATSPGNRFEVRGAWLLPESPHVICQTRLQAATKASVSCHTAGSGCRWGTALPRPRPRPPTSTFRAQRLPTGPRRCFSASDSASSSSLSLAPRPPPPPVLPAEGAVLGSLTRPPPCPASLREALGAGASAFRLPPPAPPPRDGTVPAAPAAPGRGGLRRGAARPFLQLGRACPRVTSSRFTVEDTEAQRGSATGPVASRASSVGASAAVALCCIAGSGRQRLFIAAAAASGSRGGPGRTPGGGAEAGRGRRGSQRRRARSLRRAGGGPPEREGGSVSPRAAGCTVGGWGRSPGSEPGAGASRVLAAPGWGRQRPGPAPWPCVWLRRCPVDQALSVDAAGGHVEPTGFLAGT